MSYAPIKSMKEKRQTNKNAGSKCTWEMRRPCALRPKVDDDEEEIEKSIIRPNRTRHGGTKDELPNVRREEERPPATIHAESE